MSPKRFLPLAAVVGLGLGLLGPAALPESAVASLTYCWTVFRDAPIYSTAGGSTQTGTAAAGDTFENINDTLQGNWRYGDDEQNGVYGWISDGNLTHGVPCG